MHGTVSTVPLGDRIFAKSMISAVFENGTISMLFDHLVLNVKLLAV